MAQPERPVALTHIRWTMAGPDSSNSCFWIHMSNRTYYLIAMDADDALQWVNALRRAAKIEQL